VFLDDCTELVSQSWTHRYGQLYRQGRFPMSLTFRFEAGTPKTGEGDQHDSRIAPVQEAGGEMTPPSDWFYGGSSATKEALIEINGVDEAFDGAKSLEDADTGKRLGKQGYSERFLLKRSLFHVEHEHIDTTPSYSGPTPKCNYGILLYNAWNHRRGNGEILNREKCEWVRENVCPECPNLEQCRDEELEGKFFQQCDAFETWLSLQKQFELENKYG